MSNSLTQIKKNNKFGLINAQNEIVAPCVYDFIFPFVEGFAVVMQKTPSNVNGLFGVINDKGEIIIPVQNKHINFLSEGHFLVEKEWDKFSFFNTEGKEVSKVIELSGFSQVSSLRGGFARVEWGWNDVGFINVQGEDVFGKRFASVGLFCEGLARVEDKETHLWGFINQAGELQIPCKYFQVKDFQEGLAPVDGIIDYREPRKWGYINTKGEEVIPLQFEYAGYFIDGQTFVYFKDENYDQNYRTHYAFIDKKGKTVQKVEGGFMELSGYVNLYDADGKMRLVHTNGEPVTTILYEQIGQEFCGMKKIKKDGLYGMMDLQGREIIPCLYPSLRMSSASHVHNETVRVNSSDDCRIFHERSFYKTTATVQRDGKFGGFPLIIGTSMVYKQDFIPVSYARESLVEAVGAYYLDNNCSFPILDILTKLQSSDKKEQAFAKDLLKTVNYLMETDQLGDVEIDTDILLPKAIEWATSAEMNQRIMSAHLIKALYLNIEKNHTPLISIDLATYAAFQKAIAKNPLPLEKAFEVLVPDYGFVDLFYNFQVENEDYKAFVDRDWSVKYQDSTGEILAKAPKGMDKTLEKSMKTLSKEYSKLEALTNTQMHLHLAQGKTWSGAEWKNLFLTHPYYFNFACKITWQNQNQVAFQVQEDQCLTSAADYSEISVEDTDQIKIQAL